MGDGQADFFADFRARGCFWAAVLVEVTGGWGDSGWGCCAFEDKETGG
jgi:hypothetical protein